MHEYPVTLEIVRIAEKTAREKGGLVKAIHLVVGEDSGFIGESIQMYFDVISEGTLCEGARLTIRDIKPKMRCDRCGALLNGSASLSPVPVAAAMALRQRSGRSFI